MKKTLLIVYLIGCTASYAEAQQNLFSFKKVLSKRLKEISGIAYEGNYLWAIQDEQSAKFYKLNTNGEIIQEITMRNAVGQDVEAVTFDKDFVYVADIGDNKGTKPQHFVYKIRKSDIGNSPAVTVPVETISFLYKDFKQAKEEATNNYDAEAIISFKDSLFVFTKRRGDEQTAIYALPKAPGNYVVKSNAQFNCKGLVTDAYFDTNTNQLALVGYLPNHYRPFVWLLTGFQGSNFFSGKAEQFVLTTKHKQWQIEGVSFKDDKSLFLSCKETNDEPASLYVIEASRLKRK